MPNRRTMTYCVLGIVFGLIFAFVHYDRTLVRYTYGDNSEQESAKGVVLFLHELSHDLAIACLVFAFLSVSLEYAASRHLESEVSKSVAKIEEATADTLFAGVYSEDIYEAVKPLLGAEFVRRDGSIEFQLHHSGGGSSAVSLGVVFSYKVENRSNVCAEYVIGVSDECEHDPAIAGQQFVGLRATADSKPLATPLREVAIQNLTDRYCWRIMIPPRTVRRVSLAWSVSRHTKDHYDFAMSYFTKLGVVQLAVVSQVSQEFEAVLTPLGQHEYAYGDVDPAPTVFKWEPKQLLLHGQGVTLHWRPKV